MTKTDRQLRIEYMTEHVGVSRKSVELYVDRQDMGLGEAAYIVRYRFGVLWKAIKDSFKRRKK